MTVAAATAEIIAKSPLTKSATSSPRAENSYANPTELPSNVKLNQADPMGNSARESEQSENIHVSTIGYTLRNYTFPRRLHTGCIGCDLDCV